jgi:lysophospholipase L1-like esterase
MRNPLVICYIGDSITNGVMPGTSTPSPMGGFRGHVQASLPGAGINYIASGRVIGPAQWGGHEGHNGYRTTDILDELDAILAFTPNPDIVPICLGINDVKPDASDAYRQAIPDRIGLIATEFLRRVPACWPLILPMIPNTNPTAQAWVDATNARLPSIVDGIARQSGSGRVRLLTYPRAVTLSDGTHPDEQGYQTMSAAVYWPITKIWSGEWSGEPATFPTMPTAPETVEASLTTSIDGIPYTGTVTLTRGGA